MTDSNIKPGDVVRLKSGGPRMTVAHITPTGLAHCVWFDTAWGSRSTHAVALVLVGDGNDDAPDPSDRAWWHRMPPQTPGTCIEVDDAEYEEYAAVGFAVRLPGNVSHPWVFHDKDGDTEAYSDAQVQRMGWRPYLPKVPSDD